jgi:hypothetical protein
MLLDLDKKETWHADFFSIFKNRALSEAELKERSLQVLKDNYSFVAGYHACRIRNPDSYAKKGILPSDPSEIISIARDMFYGSPRLDEVLSLSNRETLRFERSRGCIGVLLSGKWAVEADSHYFKGSERLQTISAQLLEDADVRLRKSGSATLISFKIPIKWLNEIISDDLSVYMRSLRDLLLNNNWRGGGFLLKRAIPPGYITHIENVEGKLILKRWQKSVKRSVRLHGRFRRDKALGKQSRKKCDE